jgi:magnesium-transporting ATPase (P-type)
MQGKIHRNRDPCDNFINKRWESIRTGQFVIVEKDQDIPADMLLIQSSN